MIRQQPECEHVDGGDPHDTAQPQVLPGNRAIKRDDVGFDPFDDMQRFLARRGQRIAIS